jgi:hypothetical protein
MGIDCDVIDEHGIVQRSLPDPKGHLRFLALQWSGWRESVCVRFIDPYGDAVFNQAQIPKLLFELRKSSGSSMAHDVRAHLVRLIELVESAEDEVHTYVRFVGD